MSGYVRKQAMENKLATDIQGMSNSISWAKWEALTCLCFSLIWSILSNSVGETSGRIRSKLSYVHTGYSLKSQTRYTYMHCLVIKASVVLFFDIFSVANMFFSRSYTNRIFEECREKGTQGDVAREDHGCVPVSYKFGKWIFLGCLLLSIVLVSLLYAPISVF